MFRDFPFVQMILCLSCIWFTCNYEIKALADGNEQGLMGYSAGVLISRVLKARLQIEEGWERVWAILMKSMTGVQNILKERRRRASPRCFTVPFNVYIQWIVPFCITYQLLVLTKCHRQGGANIYRYAGLFCGVWTRKKKHSSEGSIIYSPLCCSKPVWLSFFSRTQKKIFRKIYISCFYQCKKK